MEIIYGRGRVQGVSGWERFRDCADMTRTQLLWYCFPGDVEIRDGDSAIDAKLGWVPLLHFCVSMIDIYEKLLRDDGCRAEYSFTESDDVITFLRRVGAVVIASNLGPSTLECSLQQWRGAVKKFAETVLASLGGDYPRLLDTDLAAEISDGISRL